MPGTRRCTGWRCGGASIGSVVIIDTRIVAGTDDSDHIDSVGGGRFQRMNLFARQKDYIPRGETGLTVLGPHVPLAADHDDRLFVEMPVWRCLRARNVTDELRNHFRPDMPVHQHLEVAWA